VRVSLTFDNGPNAEVTPRVLDILAERQLRATFFLVGQNLGDATGQGLLRRIAKDGHRIGNHSFSHTTPLGMLDGAEAIAEISNTAKALGEAGNERLFRPFGRRGTIGHHLLNRPAWDYLAERRYSCILWNCLAREWDWPDEWAAPTIADCETRDWSVVVIHDIMPEAPRELERLLDGLQARNCTFGQDFPDDCVAMRDGVATALASQVVPMGASGEPRGT
jgi:peptidoglycan/xylan/chitin deacetylase (PgdA/CDA1 family)